MLAKNTYGLGLALMLCLLVPLPDAASAACRTSSTSSGIKHGSSVQGSTVTICAAAKQVQPARKSSVVAPKVQVAPKAAKPDTKTQPAPRAWNQYDKHRGWATPLPRVSKQLPAKPVVKKIVVQKVVPKKTITKRVGASTSKVTKSRAQESFAVQPLAISVTPGPQALPDQLLSFNSNAASHYGRGVLLGKSVEVRFQLLSINWFFGDGSAVAAAAPTHSFAEVGEYTVSGTAEYSVSYRIASTSGWLSAGPNITTSHRLLITVAGALDSLPQQQESGQVLLVGEGCSMKSRVFGCD